MQTTHAEYLSKLEKANTAQVYEAESVEYALLHRRESAECTQCMIERKKSVLSSQELAFMANDRLYTPLIMEAWSHPLHLLKASLLRKLAYEKRVKGDRTDDLMPLMDLIESLITNNCLDRWSELDQKLRVAQNATGETGERVMAEFRDLYLKKLAHDEVRM